MRFLRGGLKADERHEMPHHSLVLLSNFRSSLPAPLAGKELAPDSVNISHMARTPPLISPLETHL